MLAGNFSEMRLPNRLAKASIVAILLGWSSVAITDEAIVVEIEGVAALAAYYEQIGFHDFDNHPERLQNVPRTRFIRGVAETVEDEWRKNVPLRKALAYRIGLSAVLQANEQILADRQRLLGLSLDHLTPDDRAWLSAMAVRYKVGEVGDPPTMSLLDELMLRVDALPPSLVIVQGAIESGWLMSRFARTGQAIYGQWTTSESGIKALDSNVRLAAFDHSYESLVAYMLNINTHRAYSDLRDARAEMRRKGEPLDGYAFARHLGSYAGTGEKYVESIRGMIRRDNLTRFDTAKLGPGPRILFDRVDPK